MFGKFDFSASFCAKHLFALHNLDAAVVMPNQADEITAERSTPDRRRPDPATMQILEALELSEAELMASTAKLTIADESLKAAQLREERLLEILTKGQQRIRHLLIGAVVAGLLVVSLLAIIFLFLLKTHTH